MNPAHPITLSLSPCEGERVPIGRVRRFMGAICGLVRDVLTPEG